MRPLVNKTLQSSLKGSLTARLMSSMGEFCHMCERPLLAESLLWDRDHNHLVKEGLSSANSENLVLLCHNCGNDAEKSAQANKNSSQIIYPDKEITFRVRGGSLFEYRLEKVTQVYLDEAGEVTDEPPLERSLVLVTSASDSALQTIDYFKLNSHYLVPETMQLRIPIYESNKEVDRRLDLRTNAWHQAEEMLELFKQAPNEGVIDVLINNVRSIINASGYWAIWLTVFATDINDTQILRKIFGQQDSQSDLLRITQIDQYHPFKGTNDNWIE